MDPKWMGNGAPTTGFDTRQRPAPGARAPHGWRGGAGAGPQRHGIGMSLTAQFVRFALVGGFATTLHYAILVVLVEGLRWPPVAATSVGFAVSALGNYLLNRRFTFRSQRRHVEAAPRFAVVAVVGFFINAGVVWLAFDAAGLHYLVAQVLATLATLGWTFVGNRHWTFDHATPGPPPPDRHA
jgi:putative flippase GtrA